MAETIVRVVGWDVGGEAGDDVAVAADEELFEVPEELGSGLVVGSRWLGGEVGEVFAEASAAVGRCAWARRR